MKQSFLIIALLATYSVCGQTFDKLKLTDTEIPDGYKISNEILCKSVQPKIFFDNPDLYQSILGSVKSKDFQSFKSKDDKGTILYFEYEENVQHEGFLEGLLWGGDKPTKEHPEEYIIKDNILIIWCFPKKSAIKNISKAKISVSL